MWNDDSLLSYLVMIIFSLVVIKFLFLPGLGLIFGNSYPIVVIVTGSMEHKVVDGQLCSTQFIPLSGSVSLDKYWEICGNYYEKNLSLNKSSFSQYRFNSGLNIGDVMFLFGMNPKNIQLGDILVFKAQDGGYFYSQNGPVIHRVVKKWQDSNGQWYFQTKGDHNSHSFEHFETVIPETEVIGVAKFRVPYVGYVTLLFHKLFITPFRG